MVDEQEYIYKQVLNELIKYFDSNGDQSLKEQADSEWRSGGSQELHLAVGRTVHRLEAPFLALDFPDEPNRRNCHSFFISCSKIVLSASH